MILSEALEKASFLSKSMRSVNPGSLKKAEKTLVSNEDVLFAAYCNTVIEPLRGKLTHDLFSAKGKTNGLFIVTNLRAIWCSSILGVGDIKILPGSEIMSIDCKSNIMTGMGTVRVQGLTLLFIVDLKAKDANNAVEALNKLKSIVSIPIPQNASPHKDDYIEELERLMILVDKGVISPEDYDRKKQQLLGI